VGQSTAWSPKHVLARVACPPVGLGRATRNVKVPQQSTPFGATAGSLVCFCGRSGRFKPPLGIDGHKRCQGDPARPFKHPRTLRVQPHLAPLGKELGVEVGQLLVKITSAADSFAAHLR
jgi:hypothetical protein